ncbi:MAG TPA: lytic transglycosylase domain-containing protein [Allosphingosinicella sp.]
MASRRSIAVGGALNGFLAVALFSASPAAAQPAASWSGPIAEASVRFGIPDEWIRRVIRAESGGRTRLDGQPITSRAGAMGLMQLMPGTWREMRAAHGLGADPYDPRDNILAGTAYLRFMYERFGYPGLFAAYNAGPKRYAELLAIGRRLPAETISYVAAIAPMPMRSSGPAEKTGSASVFVPLPMSRPARIEAALQPAPPSSMFVRLSASSAQSR